VEAAGLAWLDDVAARGGVPAARPLDVGSDHIAVQWHSTCSPTPAAAERFGRQLAATHRAGARWHGCPPGEWTLDGFIGPLALPHVRPGMPRLAWGVFYAGYRLAPDVRAARDGAALSAADAAVIDRLCDRIAGGGPAVIGPEPEPARLHGDLWSGNVLWTPTGAVLIDPAAHGGHRETDLAMLALFGLPLLDRAIAAYDEAWPLADGWRDRIGLHQLHPLLVHAALFGGGYGRQAVATARRYG
jgi:fructosamine-3-kinase